MASNTLKILGFTIVIIGGLTGIISGNVASAGLIISVGVLIASVGDVT